MLKKEHDRSLPSSKVSALIVFGFFVSRRQPFRLEYKTSVICHNVNTQNVKIARRDILGRVVQSWVKITQGKHEN